MVHDDFLGSVISQWSFNNIDTHISILLNSATVIR